MFPWKARKGTVKQSGRMLLDSDDEFEHELDTLLARHLNRLEMSETSPTDFEVSGNSFLVSGGSRSMQDNV